MSVFRKMVLKLGEASSRIFGRRSDSEVDEGQEMFGDGGVKAEVNLLEDSDMMERLRQENEELRRRLEQLEEKMDGERKQEEAENVKEVVEDQDEEAEMQEDSEAIPESEQQLQDYEVKEETLEEQDPPMALSRRPVVLPPPPAFTGEAPYRYSNSRTTSSTAPKFLHHCPDAARVPQREGDPWHCVCGRSFPTQGKLTEHVNYFTREPRFFCPRCPIRFTSLRALRDHLATCHKLTDYFPPGSRGCGDCGHMSANREAHKAHRLANHPRWTERLKYLSHGVDTTAPKGILRCLCRREFNRPKNLSEHLQNYNSPAPFRCAHCPSTFAQFGLLRRHLRKAHKLPVPRGQLGCRVCAALFPSRKELQTHMHRAHDIITWYQPPKSSSGGGLDDPAQRATSHGVASPRKGDSLQRCLCGSGYAKRAQLLQHVQKAQKTVRVPFKCPQCPVEFRVNARLSLHMRRIHGLEDYKAYGCTACGNTFDCHVALRRHRDGEHPQLRISRKKKDGKPE